MVIFGHLKHITNKGNKMKIELNHELDNINDIIDEMKIIPSTTDDMDEDEIKNTLKKFNDVFQAFDVGMLVTYLSIKKEYKIDKVSEAIQEIVNDLGWKNFFSFFEVIDASFKKTIEEYEAQQKEPITEDKETPKDVEDLNETQSED